MGNESVPKPKRVWMICFLGVKILAKSDGGMAETTLTLVYML
jgi:hypothetical protein